MATAGPRPPPDTLPDGDWADSSAWLLPAPHLRSPRAGEPLTQHSCSLLPWTPGYPRTQLPLTCLTCVFGFPLCQSCVSPLCCLFICSV